MKAAVILALILVSVVLVGCAQPAAPAPAPAPVPQPEPAPQPLPGSTQMTLEEARTIAASSECTQEGTLTDSAFYNENTRTWWIDLALEQPGCKPACVVSEETRSAEINWRCTGLIIP